MKTLKAFSGPAMAICVVVMSCTPTANFQDRNRAVILKANEELFTKGNLQFADEAFTDDYSFPGMDLKGPELVKHVVTQLKTAFPDLQYKVETTVAEGDLVAWTRTHTGTLKADFMGYKATGKVMTWNEITISRFTDDGRIAAEIGQSDFLQNFQHSTDTTATETLISL